MLFCYKVGLPAFFEGMLIARFSHQDMGNAKITFLAFRLMPNHALQTDAQPRSLTRQGATQFLLLLLRTDTCACRESGMAQLRPLALRLSHPGLQSSEDNWQGSASKLTSTVAGRIQLLTGRSTEAVCWLDITFSLSSCSSVTSRSGSRALPLWPPPHLSSTKVC
nr:uncharacterized protein LOC128779467 isoform X3 [Desmodus rotundus]